MHNHGSLAILQPVYDKNRLQFTVDLDGRRRTVHVNYPDFFTVKNDSFASDIMMSALVTMQGIFDECIIELPFRLSERKKNFWCEVYDKYYVYFMARIKRNLTENRIEFKFSDSIPKNSYSNLESEKHLVSLGMGKDSLLTAGLLSEIYGKDNVFNVIVNYAKPDWIRKRISYSKFASLGYKCTRVYSDINRLRALMIDFVWPERRVWKPLFYDFGHWVSFLTIPAPLAPFFGAKYVWMGNEIDCTRKSTYQGRVHYDFLLEQSRFFQEQYTSSEDGLIFSSILTPMYEYAVQKVLVTRYPQLAELQQSCVSQSPKRTWCCSSCRKCAETYFMLRSLSARIPKGLDSKKIVDKNPYLALWKRQYETESQNDLEITEKSFIHSVAKLQKMRMEDECLRSFIQSFGPVSELEEAEALHRNLFYTMPTEVWSKAHPILSKCLSENEFEDKKYKET